MTPMPKTGGQFTGPIYSPGGSPTDASEYVTKGYVDGISGVTPEIPFTETPSGSVNGSNTDFTLSHTPTANTLHLYLNGVFQTPGVDYNLSGTTITFITAPDAGAVFAIYTYT